jgi:uncharacterized membrane protein
MNRPAPRSVDEYLRQLREAFGGDDPALIQDALYDAEEYLRSEIAAHPDKSEGDVLELIASTYGDPQEVAAAYRDTEAKVKAALAPPPALAPDAPALRRFFGVFLDSRAWTSLFFLVLCLVTGIFYFTFAVTGLSLSAGLAVLVIGVPFFLAFVGLARAIALGEGRLIEAMTGERMPRRPSHPGEPKGFWQRVVAMLKDLKTWTTLAYFVLMLPLGILYFLFAALGVSVGLAFVFAPLAELGSRLGFLPESAGIRVTVEDGPLYALDSPFGMLLMFVAGILVLTLTMHGARAIGRGHARMAKALLVERA